MAHGDVIERGEKLTSGCRARFIKSKTKKSAFSDRRMCRWLMRELHRQLTAGEVDVHFFTSVGVLQHGVEGLRVLGFTILVFRV